MRAAAMMSWAAPKRCCLVGALLVASAVPARGISVRSSSWHMPVVGNLLVSGGFVRAAAARGAARFSSKGPRADVPGVTRRRLDECVNDDSTTDSDGDTCSSWYDSNPGDCGGYDDTDFTASAQCCACGGGLAGGTFAPTITPAPSAAPSTKPTPEPSTQSPTGAPTTAAPSVTIAPTPTPLPYEYAPTVDAMPYCRLLSSSVCWGNTQRFLRVTANGPFDGMDLGSWGAPALGDLDGDGDLDLVVGESTCVEGECTGSLNYIENTGTATAPVFVQRTGSANPFDAINVGWSSAPPFADRGTVPRPAVADLDGDGTLRLRDLDLVVGNDMGLLNYIENTGTSTVPVFVQRTGNANPFDAVGIYGIYVGQMSAPALADFDNDGDLDLVVGEDGGSLKYMENTGTSTAPAFVLRTGSANPFDGIFVGYSSAPAVADIDNDGTLRPRDLDLVVGNVGELVYIENTGTSTAPVFVQRADSANPFDGIDVGSYSAPALGHLDNDGDLDLVVGNVDGELNYIENTGTSAAAALVQRAGSTNPFDGIDVGDYSNPALGDFDGDGTLRPSDLDLVVGEFTGSLNYIENTGTSTAPVFVRRTGSENPFNGIGVGYASATALADLDNDGDLDLVVGDDDGLLNYIENTGTATEPEFVLPFDGIDAGGWSSPTLGDLDGDGDFDIVVGSDENGLKYYENTGTSTAPAFVQRTGGANPFDGIDVDPYSAPALADFDNDGMLRPRDLDLVVGNSNGELNYIENTGTSTAPVFVARTGDDNPFAGINVGFYIAPALGDLDGDGTLRPCDLDLVVGNTDGLFNYFANGFCTTSCGGRGVCDGSANLLPTCDCLTGFTGDQCDDCQAGYFGSTCELCPEGGGETKAAPRILDTCGVAGSGRSRGACDDGFTNSGNCTCFDEHFTGDDCSGGGCPAGTVESARQNGVFYEAFCEPCKEGTYQVGDECSKCPPPSTSASTGEAGCYTCTEGYYFSEFVEGSARCDNMTALAAQCEDLNDPACFDKCCLPCKKGMDCTNSATNTLQDVAIADGWWRNTLFSDKLYRCEYEDSCEGGICTEGHEGVACRVCKADFYYSAVDSKCVECGSLHAHPLAIASGICLILLLVASIYVFRRRRPRLFSKVVRAVEENLKDMAMDAGSEDVDVIDEGLGGMAQPVALSGAQDGLDGAADVAEAASGALEEEEGEEDNDAADADEEKENNFMHSVQTKLKILLAVYQIQNALPWTLPYISYPDAFDTVIAWMSFIELDFVRIVPMSCVMSYNFFDKLFASTLFPLVLAAVILGLGKLSSLLRRDPADQRAAWIYAYSWFLLLTYVVFTGASITVFRFFNCVEYESRDATGSRETLRVLQADHSISCDSPSYDAWKGYAVIMVLIYPIGIPLLYLCELLYHRKAINPEVDERRHHRADAYDRGAAPQTPDQRAYFRFRARESKSMRDLRHQAFQDVALSKEEIQERKIEARSGDASIAHLAFLFAEYEPRCYLFVVFECIRRLMLTGMLIFIYAGSLTQITIGLLFAFLSYGMMMDFSPYIEDLDDRLADVGQSQIVLVFIASLVLFAKDMPEQEGAPGNLFRGPLFAFVMVMIGTMTLLMTFYMLVAEYCGIGSPEDAQEAAGGVASSLRRFTRGRKRFSETKVPQATGDDAAPEEIVVTPHGA